MCPLRRPCRNIRWLSSCDTVALVTWRLGLEENRSVSLFYGHYVNDVSSKHFIALLTKMKTAQHLLSVSHGSPGSRSRSTDCWTHPPTRPCPGVESLFIYCLCVVNWEKQQMCCDVTQGFITSLQCRVTWMQGVSVLLIWGPKTKQMRAH